MFRGRLFLALAGGVLPLSLFASLSLEAGSPSKKKGLTPTESRGKIIYTTGRSPSGREISFWLVGGGQRLPAGGVTCATCHGKDGRGGQEGDVRTPDVTYEALTKPGHVTLPSGRKRAPYTDALLVRAITQGLDSSGQQLNLLMPRWALSDSELQDLLAHLKRLGKEHQ